MNEQSAPATKLLYNVKEVTRMLGIGRSRLYAYILSGELRTLKLGRRRLITPEAVREFVESQVQNQDSSSE